MLKNGIFCEMVILVIFKGFLLVKNLEILIQIVPDRSIYYYYHVLLHIAMNHEGKQGKSIGCKVPEQISIIGFCV